MSGGEQQMLVIGRALMAKPKLLLLDEPSLGVAPKIVQDIARSIVAINRDEKVSVLLVEQNSRMALRISNRAYALTTGSIALSGASADLVKDERIQHLYLGGDFSRSLMHTSPSLRAKRSDPGDDAPSCHVVSSWE